MSKMSYFEVPEKDAAKVMRALDGTTYKGRQVRCNDADRGTPTARKGGQREGEAAKKDRKRSPQREDNRTYGRKDDWRQFFNNGGKDVRLIGDEPDFSEEGWARRKPKK